MPLVAAGVLLGGVGSQSCERLCDSEYCQAAVWEDGHLALSGHRLQCSAAFCPKPEAQHSITATKLVLRYGGFRGPGSPKLPRSTFICFSKLRLPAGLLDLLQTQVCRVEKPAGHLVAQVGIIYILSLIASRTNRPFVISSMSLTVALDPAPIR